MSEVAMETALLEEFHSVHIWSITVSRFVSTFDVSFMTNPIYAKHESCVVLAYGKGSDVLEQIMGQIQLLSYHPSWNPRARFIVISITKEDSPIHLAQKLLSYLWQWKIINVVTLIAASRPFDTKFTQISTSIRMFELYTWFPYKSPHQCSNVQDVFLVDKWIMEGEGHFIMNTNLFPNKIKNNLHRCPIIATTFPLQLATGNAKQIITGESTNIKVTYSEGWETEFLQVVAEGLNSSLDYLLPPPNNEKWGTFENGTLTGLIGDLVYNRADIGFAAWPLHPSILMAVDPTVSYFRDGWAWWVSCAKKVPRWKSILMIFSTGTWTAGLFSVTLALFSMVFLAKSVHRGRILQEWRIYRSFLSCFSCVWAVLLAVSVPELPRTASLRTFFISWVCYCFAVNTVFQAFLITFLINPGLQHQMNSFEEIIASGVGFGYNPIFDVIFSDSENFIPKRRVACYDNNRPPCMDWVAHHNNFSLLCSAGFMDYILTRWYLDENGKPLICQAGDTFYGTNYVTYMAKGNPLLEHFNRIITRIIESGLMDQRLKERMDLQSIKAATRARQMVTGKYYNLSLEYLQGAFLICMGGLMLSTLVFIEELLHHQFRMRKDRHVK
jgi:hypothetical protein